MIVTSEELKVLEDRAVKLALREPVSGSWWHPEENPDYRICDKALKEIWKLTSKCVLCQKKSEVTLNGKYMERAGRNPDARDVIDSAKKLRSLVEDIKANKFFGFCSGCLPIVKDALEERLGLTGPKEESIKETP
jgi:hypothetical protein